MKRLTYSNAGQLPAGPRGPQGSKGDAGAPGSAVAYARVIVTASSATIDPSQSKGVANANVSRIGPGVCGASGQAAVATVDPAHQNDPADPPHPADVDASYFVIFE
jgi:hypothetical protein